MATPAERPSHPCEITSSSVGGESTRLGALSAPKRESWRADEPGVLTL
jgi:hypothetical protein